MELAKIIVRKSTNPKAKLLGNIASTTPTVRQYGKALEPQLQQSASPKKRGPKRKLQLPIETTVKRNCLRTPKERPKLHSNVEKLAIKKQAKSGTAERDTSDDSFTEDDDEEESSLKYSSDDDKPLAKTFKIKSQLNGEKKSTVYSSPRVRKPNPKFQDFITSPKVRSVSNVDKPTKEKGDVIKLKMKPRVKNVTSSVEKDPLDLVNMNPVPESMEDDDVVRSFLPVLDKPKVLYDSEEDRYRNMKNKSKLNSGKADKVASNEKDTDTDTEKSKDKTKRDISDEAVVTTESTSTTTTVPISTSDTNSVTTTVLSSSTSPINESKLDDDLTDSVISHKKANNLTVRKYTRIPAKKNKKFPLMDVRKKQEPTYCLVESEGASYRTKSPKASDVDFNKLVRTLKSVKLPASNWKIRIVVSRQQTITEVTFTNKEVNERCVKFSRVFTGYIITFGKSVVNLVGAPNRISSFNDVTILLDIIHNVSLNDPILQYITDKQI